MLLNGTELFFNKQLNDKFGANFNLARVLNHLIVICDLLDYKFEECFEMAYNEIKDRKGRWVKGVWIKEKDLKK